MTHRFFAIALSLCIATLLCSCTGATDATFDQAASASYEGILDDPFTLVAGRFEGEAYEDNAASRPVVQLLPEPSALYDLDGDGFNEAIVALVANFGGSGAYVYLAIVDAEGGVAKSAAVTSLGDRVQLKSITVKNGVIAADFTGHGPNDPMCCPSLEHHREWVYEPGNLVNTAGSGTRFRGQVVLGHEVRTFTECDSERQGWLFDQTAGDLGNVYETLAAEQYQPLFFEVIGYWQPAPDTGFAADFDETISVTEVRRAEREGFGCREKLANVVFQARGNEPSWQLDVQDSKLVFTAMGSAPISFDAPEMEELTDDISIMATGPESSIKVVLTDTRCTDSMSGSIFALTASVQLDDSNYIGCALEGMAR
jgi:uncharacterized membrane protein